MSYFVVAFFFAMFSMLFYTRHQAMLKRAKQRSNKTIDEYEKFVANAMIIGVVMAAIFSMILFCSGIIEFFSIG